MMSFTQLNLNPSISKALQACGYDQPTPIQAQSIPDILDGKDIVASAQTGTGKTAAFVLPALHRLSETKGTSKPRVLILTPTRELATQIMDAVSKYGKFMRLNVVSLVGGMPYRQQLKGLSRPVDIIVATPGRLLDHMQTGRVKLSEIEMLILDEADRMLDMGFIDDVKEIAKATPDKRQTLLFSATVDNKLDRVIKQLLKNPTRIDLSQAKMSPIKIKQEIYMADNVQHKTRLLEHFIKDGNIFKAIIFSATKVNADKLSKQLDKDGYSVAALHGDLKQNVRNRTIEAMRRGKIQFLIATDVAARGIDIHDITHVINFDLPKFHEDYVHRIGRTGRAGRSGTAISFALPEDGRHLQGIERYIGEKIALNTVPGLEATKSFSFGGAKKKRGRGNAGGGKPSHRFKNDAPKKKEAFGAKKNSRFKDEKPRREDNARNAEGKGRDYFKKSDFRNDNAERGRFGGENKERSFKGGKSFKKESAGFKGESDGGRKDFNDKRDGGRKDFKDKRDGGRKDFKDKRDGGRKDFKDKRDSGRKDFKDKRDGGRKDFKDKRDGGSKDFKDKRDGGRKDFKDKPSRSHKPKGDHFKSGKYKKSFAGRD